MNLKNLSSADLKQIGQLLKERAALVGGVEKIDRQLQSYQGVLEPQVGTPTKAAPRKRRKLKQTVAALLQKAGKGGATVKDIARRLKVDPNRIYTWFYSTGNRMGEIKKVGEARYAWVG